MTYRIRNIAIAIALALTAALLTTFYVSNYKRSVQKGEANVRVYVATSDIAAGVSGAAVADRHLLEPRDVARRSVVPGAISDPAEIGSLVLTAPVYAGEQVTTRRFGSTSAAGIRGQLKGSLRALQVPGDSNQLLAGTLRAGDRVDLVSNLPGGPDDHFSRIVVRDIKVLRAPNGAKINDRAGGVTDTVLLAVRDTQVQRFWFGVQNGDWSLELRPATDAADSHEVVETPTSVFTYGQRSAR